MGYTRIKKLAAASTDRKIIATFTPEQQAHILAADHHSWNKGLQTVLRRDMARVAAGEPPADALGAHAVRLRDRATGKAVLIDAGRPLTDTEKQGICALLWPREEEAR